MSARHLALVGALALASVVTPFGQGDAAQTALQEWTGTVTKIVDGDTVFVAVDGQSSPVEVRIGGLQTSEKVGVNGLPECYSAEATSALADLLEDTRVVLKARNAGSMSLGRPIRHVFLNGVNVAVPMLRGGFGVPLVFGNEPDFATENANQSLLAARDGLGVFNDEACGSGPFAGAVIDMITNYDAAHDDSTNVNGEYVQIRNRGTVSFGLDGWILRDAALRRFELPDGYVLDPGARLRIFVGHGTNTSNSIYLRSNVPLFGNDSDGVFLHDPDFDIRAFNMWPCDVTCVQPPKLQIERVNYDAIGDDNVNPNGEFVVIRNAGTTTVDFQDWMIDLPRFQITSIASRPLAPGATITLFMGSGTNTATTLYLGETGGILSNSNHIVTLYTPERTVAACDSRGTSVCPTVLTVRDPDAMQPAERIGNATQV